MKKKNKNNSSFKTAILCPCCKQKLLIEITPVHDKDIVLDKEQKEKAIKDALLKNGIELASNEGGE